MSRASVLSIVGTYLQGGIGTIPHLSEVNINPPKFVNKGAFYEGGVPNNAESGAIIWLWLGPQYAKRTGYQGNQPGGKMVYYDLHLQCVLLCASAKSENADNDNNAFIDGLTAWIEKDKRAGDTTPTSGSTVPALFQWGESDTPFGKDMEFEPGWPIPLNNSITHVYTKGTVIVCESHPTGT